MHINDKVHVYLSLKSKIRLKQHMHMCIYHLHMYISVGENKMETSSLKDISTLRMFYNYLLIYLYFANSNVVILGIFEFPLITNSYRGAQSPTCLRVGPWITKFAGGQLTDFKLNGPIKLSQWPALGRALGEEGAQLGYTRARCWAWSSHATLNSNHHNFC